MTTRSHPAAAPRAAQAALTRAQDFDRYLLIEDTDDDSFEIRTLLRERSPRGMEVQP
jgi:hypothetical protein